MQKKKKKTKYLLIKQRPRQLTAHDIYVRVVGREKATAAALSRFGDNAIAAVIRQLPQLPTATTRGTWVGGGGETPAVACRRGARAHGVKTHDRTGGIDSRFARQQHCRRGPVVWSSCPRRCRVRLRRRPPRGGGGNTSNNT